MITLFAIAVLVVHTTDALYTLNKRNELRGRYVFEVATEAFEHAPSFPPGVCRPWPRSRRYGKRVDTGVPSTNMDGWFVQRFTDANCTKRDCALPFPGCGPYFRVLALEPPANGTRLLCDAPLPEPLAADERSVAAGFDDGRAYSLRCPDDAQLLLAPRDDECVEAGRHTGDSKADGYLRFDTDRSEVCRHTKSDCSDGPTAPCESYANFTDYTSWATSESERCTDNGVCRCAREYPIRRNGIDVQKGNSVYVFSEPVCDGCRYDAQLAGDRCPGSSSAPPSAKAPGAMEDTNECSARALRTAKEKCFAGGASRSEREAILALNEALASDADGEPTASDFGEACDYARDMIECLVEAHPAACGPLADTFDDDDVCGPGNRAKLEALDCDACELVPPSAAAKEWPPIVLGFVAALLTATA